jgi:hypothetical protein
MTCNGRDSKDPQEEAMANIVGTCIDALGPAPAERERRSWSKISVSSEEGEDQHAEAKAPATPPAPSRQFTQVARVLAQHEDGLTVVELCGALSESSERMQAILAEGIRAGRVRRSGSRCHTRYILNR